jgi:hypothetical protein
MKRFPIFIALLILAVTTIATAHQVILNPSQDSNIATYDHDNYGYSVFLFIGEHSGYGKMWYPIIQFQLSPYHDVIVESAFLQLYVNSAEGAFPPTSIWIGRITGMWFESSVTWDNFPGADDSTFIGGPDSINDWWIIDVSSYVNSWVSGSYDNYGFILGTLDYRYNIFDMYSRDYDVPALRPKLELNYHDVCVNPVSLGNIRAIFK